MPNYKTEGPYRAEVKVYGENHWATNALRFDTPEEAEAYARDLYARWTQVQEARVVPSDTPDREPHDPADPHRLTL